jgi:hypothetical protein
MTYAQSAGHHVYGSQGNANVPHVFEPAASGRSKCRGCSLPIAKGEMRFGERLHNLFGEGEMTLWFHLRCGAYKRPESFLQALADATIELPDREAIERAARNNAAQRRLPRINGAERASSGQARCRQCRNPIAKGDWRIRLVFFEEGFFNASGFVHLACREPYFGTADILEPLLHFSRDLGEQDIAELKDALAAAPSSS